MLKAISSVVLGHVADKTPFPIDAPMFSLFVTCGCGIAGESPPYRRSYGVNVLFMTI